MESPLISVVIPVFNGERFLKVSLDSIFGQSYRPLEVIVIDDGSTDGTQQVVKQYPEKIRYRRQDNSGAPSARNRGIGLAKADFISFADADDLWHPAKLERQMARLEAEPTLDVVVVHAQNFWMPELAREYERVKDQRRSKAIPAYISAAMLVRRRVFESVGVFSASMRHADGTAWFLRARDKDVAVALLRDVLIFRRMHKLNTSRVKAGESLDEFFGLIKANLDHRNGSPDAQGNSE
ncbi:MAG: glycosyltransferase family 2 protein [Deltaproteobacteria bacterium]|nr:glycosyltransferase family 2 protein [Deltaproteobacteria bacterium]